MFFVLSYHIFLSYHIISTKRALKVVLEIIISYIHLQYIETKLLTFIVLFSCLIHFFAFAVFTCEYFASQTIMTVTLLVMVIFS